MSKYGYLEVFQRVPSTSEIMRVNCNTRLTARNSQLHYAREKVHEKASAKIFEPGQLK